MVTSDFFKNIIKWNLEKSGVQIPHPFFFQDALFLVSLFTASTKKVSGLIPHSDLHPIELTPGRCLVGFSAFEYRQSDISAYNELSISFLVSYKKKPIPLLTLVKSALSGAFPAYIWQLPVTSEIARAGGIALYNTPKFLADIDFIRSKDSVGCSLSVSGSEILQMTSRVLPTKPIKPTQFVSYFIMEGSVIYAKARINPIEFAQSFRPGDFKLKIGKDHPICQTLHTLELSKRPFVSQYCPRCEIILFPAHNILDT